MQTVTTLVPASRFLTRLCESGCAFAVDPELEHLDTALWESVQPHLEADGVARFESEEAALAAGALVQRVEPHR